MKNICLIIACSMLLFSCNLPEMKELTSESKKEVASIVKELKLEQFGYSYHSKTEFGKTKKVFFIDLYNIDDSTDFKAYNERVIEVFEKSNYELKSQDFIRIGYFKKYFASDIYVFYDIDPKTNEIINEGTQ
jgi:hypothetical protein